MRKKDIVVKKKKKTDWTTAVKSLSYWSHLHLRGLQVPRQQLARKTKTRGDEGEKGAVISNLKFPVGVSGRGCEVDPTSTIVFQSS